MHWKKISENKSHFIFSVKENGVLEGILSDGDLRRWLVERNDIDLDKRVFELSNKVFVSCRVDENPQTSANWSTSASDRDVDTTSGLSAWLALASWLLGWLVSYGSSAFWDGDLLSTPHEFTIIQGRSGWRHPHWWVPSPLSKNWWHCSGMIWWGFG